MSAASTSQSGTTAAIANPTASISSSAKSNTNKFSSTNGSVTNSSIAINAAVSVETAVAASGAHRNQPNYLSPGSSAAFQQIKQTQASLARLSRVLNQQQHQHNQTIQSSQQASKQTIESGAQQQQQKLTSFVDCLIRRFKDCFSEDFCTVPMFVVGNLSPGSDGTHLILPPCVSLGGQNINRFVGPKNLRLMNSIRESCKSIEELDLGGNKLTDLIEVYKILQCTPNLKFLNLSENDLSRTPPVAMAATCSSSSSSSSAMANLSTSLAQPSATAQHQQHWSSSSVILSNRTFLGPINQNQQQAIGSRRHSTLGQQTASHAVSNQTRTRQATSRVAEARRLAAAAAVAQTKKTSPSVASKLTNSATAVAGSLTRPIDSNTSRSIAVNRELERAGSSKSGRCSGVSQRQSGTSSTMHLARSLSSLSAKDVRSSSSPSSRSNIAVCKDVSLNRGPATISQQQQTHRSSVADRIQANDSPSISISRARQMGLNNKHKLDATDKLFVELIAESDDVDMGEQQQASPSINQSQHQQSTTAQLSSSSNQSRALAPQTGSSYLAKSSSLLTGTFASPNFKRTFESIKALALNNTGCQWRVVCSILSRMPNLEELHLSLNNYEKIDLDPNDFKHHSLKKLYLCNNPKLTNWEELDKLLIAFPSLEALSIADCNISQIPDNLGMARGWQKLCGLNINGWPIKEWPIIERLNQLPSLIDLKCRNLEILNTIDEPRHHLIARLPKLQRLNGSEIEEREHAEKAFLRFFMANSHLERPSRFHELVQIHGEITPVDVDVDLSPPSQAHVRVIHLNRNHYCKENEDDVLMSEDFLIKLMDTVDPNVVQHNSLECMEMGDVLATSSTANDNDEGDTKLVRLFKDEGQEVLAIDVDLRQSVRKFKTTLASLFGLESQNLILYYIDHEMVGLMGPELIKHNQRKLWNYNVQDGDQFIVEER